MRLNIEVDLSKKFYGILTTYFIVNTEWRSVEASLEAAQPHKFFLKKIENIFFNWQKIANLTLAL